jgi:hypothetical protein
MAAGPRALALVLTLQAACGPEASPGSHAPFASHTDLPCQALAEGPMATPEPWTVVSEDFELTSDWYDASPYAQGSIERQVDALTVFDGKLWAGLGDWNSRIGSLFCPDDGGPCPYEDADGHGIPIYGLAPGDDAGSWSMVTRNEEIERFRRTGDSLLVPSTDPTEGDGPPACAEEGADPVCPEELDRAHPEFAEGWIYRHRRGTWEELGPLDQALHVFDVVAWRGRLVAAGSARSEDGRNHAAIWQSNDDGASWDRTLDDAPEGPGTYRLTTLVPFEEELVALGYLNVGHGRQPLRYRGGPDGWREALDLLPSLSGRVGAELLDADTALIWPQTGAAFTEAQALHSAGGELKSRPLSALEGLDVRAAWMNCAGDLLLLGASSASPCCEHSLLRTADLRDFELLLSWRDERSYSSLAAWEQGVALGGPNSQLFLARPTESPPAVVGKPDERYGASSPATMVWSQGR